MTDKRWVTYLTSMSGSPIYHPAWLQVLEELYGYKPMHLACEDAGGNVVGILPLFYQRGWRSGRVLRSVFTGSLSQDERVNSALLEGAIARTCTRPGAELHLKLMSNAVSGLVAGMVGIPAYETYMLALPERAEQLHLDSSIRRAINKAIRMGLEVREAQTENELYAWYELYLHTMRKFQALPNPYRYYKVAWQRLHSKGMMRLLLAEQVEAGQRRLLAGFFYLMYEKAISYVSAGWKEEDQSLRPNDLLHWRAIEQACSQGLRYYDFGDVDLENEGLARYKSKWGAKSILIYDYSYPESNQRSSNAHIVSRDSANRLVGFAWQHLPDRAVSLLSDVYVTLHLY